jgi:hypothetical protein
MHGKSRNFSKAEKFGRSIIWEWAKKEVSEDNKGYF